MTKEFKSAAPNMWHWKQASPFSQSVTAGDQVYLSGQHTLDENGAVLDCGDIAAQTRNVFENMKLSLAQVGLEISDLVRLNTYYVFEGNDEDATRYWEDMTRVRLEYFPDPGPAATAVRAKGMPYPGQLIQIEGIALRGESRSNRQRIMPDGSWDWSISVPLSQGWKIEDRIFVGGQISADKTGASVHIGDLDAQTRNIYQYIEQVLSEAGSSFKDVVHIKVCFKYDSKDPTSGKDFVDRIMEITEEYIDGPAPVLTAFAVDLLYPGLDLEIDAVAIVDSNRQTLTNTDSIGRYQPSVFSDGVKAKNEIYVAGQTALAEDGTVKGDFADQAREVYTRVQKVLSQANTSMNDIAKLNLFIVSDDGKTEDYFHQACGIWAEMFPDSHPAMTPVQVHELARPELLFQADCVAIL
jgi:enamine deaminase RidA (YjgF/YER057c/UK114 family)